MAPRCVPIRAASPPDKPDAPAKEMLRASWHYTLAHTAIHTLIDAVAFRHASVGQLGRCGKPPIGNPQSRRIPRKFPSPARFLWTREDGFDQRADCRIALAGVAHVGSVTRDTVA